MLKSADQKTVSKKRWKNYKPLEPWSPDLLKHSAKFPRWLAEALKAEERVRRFPDRNGRSNPQHPLAAVMRWVLNFAYLDLDGLSEGDFANLKQEFLCVSQVIDDLPFFPEDFSEDRSGPDKEHMVVTQKWLQRTVGQIKERQEITFIDPETEWFFAYDDESQRWTWHSTMDTKHYGPIVMFRIFRKHIDDLLVCKCEDCEQPLFLRDRQNQDYCSHRCKWRHAQRNRPGRTIPPERFGKPGRPPGQITTKGKADGQKQKKEGTAATRPHSRRVSTKRP